MHTTERIHTININGEGRLLCILMLAISLKDDTQTHKTKKLHGNSQSDAQTKCLWKRFHPTKPISALLPAPLDLTLQCVCVWHSIFIFSTNKLNFGDVL